MAITKIEQGAIATGAVDSTNLDSSVNDTINNVTVDTVFTGDSITVPAGDTASRPGTPVNGMVRYNTDTGLVEQYNSAGWQGIDAPPTVTGFSGTINEDTDSTITVTGSNFKPGSAVYIEGAAVSVPRPLATSYISSTELQANTNATNVNFTGGASFNVKVTNPSGLSSVLEPAGTIDRDPVWNTAAGNVADISDLATGTHATLDATDPDGTSVTYTITNGSFPGGLTFDTNNGVIAGDPTNVSTDTTFTFEVEAESNSFAQSRTFNIIVRPGLDGTSSTRAAASASDIQTLTGTTTNGLYWINLPTVGPTQVFCNMDTYGGGWMLAMRLDSTLGTGTVRHYFDPNWWTNATSGLVSAPSNPYTNGEGKYAPYSYFPHTEFMLEYGYGSSYWANTARARYSYTGSFPAHNNTTMLYKQGNAGVNFSGNYTINGYRTDQTRWTRQQASDTVYFPSVNAHLNYASSATSNSDGGNDFFRIYINNNGDTDTIDDGGDCNQVGGWGMVGDIAPSNATQMALESWNYDAGNSSATISPPYGSVGTSCQWNDQRTAAGNSGKNYQSNTAVRVSSSYYDNGVGLIWLR